MAKIEKIIGIIPARGGSKGLPKKNIRFFAGKPLIGWTIEAAFKSGVLDRIIVSTDEQEIADIALGYGAECPVLRPRELALDDTPTLPVLQHMVAWLETSENYSATTIVTLQPTSPLRRPEHIQEAVELLNNTKADSIVSVCLAEHSPYWMKVLKGDRVYPFLEGSTEYLRRQDLPPIYRLNGAIHVTRHTVLMQQNSILGCDTRAIVMDLESSVDIDTPLDFKIAEFLLKRKINENSSNF